MEPGNLKAEGIPIVLLRALDISHGEFRHWWGDRC
jgi:hypothetical protein